MILSSQGRTSVGTKQRLVIESMFKIVDKEGQDVPFVLNSAQRYLDDNWASRTITPKARQEGVSSYWLAYFAVECLARRNTRAVVISHETDATARMLSKVKYYLDNLRGPKPVIDINNRNELTFPKTNSVFYIGTAGSRKFGRGDTITHLLCSEIAYWPDAKALATGLFQAVPRSGVLAIESTGNGAGNYYHSLCMRAAAGQSTFRLNFLPWHTFPEYRELVSEGEAAAVLANLSEELDEPALAERYNLDAGQLLFRRRKLEEFDYDLQMWNQEYPSCLDDCFQASGAGIFHKVRHVATPNWKKRDTFLWALEGHPKPNRAYVVGADIGAGVRKDNTVFEIFDLETLEQVGEWICNRLDPAAAAKHLASVAETFSNAYISCESNNHGILTLSELRALYPLHLIHRIGPPSPKPDEAAKLQNMGVRTTSRSKPLMIGELRSALAKEATIHSDILKSECTTFVEHEDGSLGAQDGCNDDTVMASACAIYVRSRASLALIGRDLAETAKPEDDPLSFDAYLAQKEEERRSNLNMEQYGVE